MKTNVIGRVLMLAAVAAMATVSMANLTIGAKAPELKASKWFKGKAVPKFEKGKVYVVEFWATWCGPCIQSIPHITEMAKEFKGKATFIGMSIWENPENRLANVEKFVKNMGDKMDYNVAADTEDGFMDKNWAKAGKIPGIPTAFIVNGDGVIAWVGHPMGDMHDALKQIVDGKWDMKVAAEKLQKEKDAEAALQKVGQTFMGHMQAGNYKAALESVETGIAGANLDPAMANSVKASMLNSLAWELLTNEKIKNPDFAIALQAAEKAYAASNDDPMVGDTYSLALFKNGKKAEAVALQEKCIAKAKTISGFDAATLKEMEQRLAEFKKGA